METSVQNNTPLVKAATCRLRGFSIVRPKHPGNGNPGESAGDHNHHDGTVGKRLGPPIQMAQFGSMFGSGIHPHDGATVTHRKKYGY
jgi:hypothetical protein